jgi:hypothetical protein
MPALRSILLMSCLVSISAPAICQDMHKNQLGLLLGADIVPDRHTVTGNNIDLGKSVVFSANYARHLAGDTTAIYLEFPFAAAPSHTVGNPQTGSITDLATLFITPSVRLQFANAGTVSPWVSGGFGYGQYEGSKRLAGGALNPDVRQHVSTAQFGGGVDIRTPIHILFPIGLRAELRDYYTVSAPSFGVPVRDGGQHNIVVAGGIVLRF